LKGIAAVTMQDHIFTLIQNAQFGQKKIFWKLDIINWPPY